MGTTQQRSDHHGVEAHTLIVVANEPAMYREVLVRELAHRRPHLTVLLVLPTALDPIVARLRPRLVICSEVTASVREHAAASILLYPQEQNQAIVTIAEQSQVLPHPELSDLLTAVDAATRVA